MKHKKFFCFSVEKLRIEKIKYDANSQFSDSELMEVRNEKFFYSKLDLNTKSYKINTKGQLLILF